MRGHHHLPKEIRSGPQVRSSGARRLEGRVYCQLPSRSSKAVFRNALTAHFNLFQQNSQEWLNYPDCFLIYGFLAPRIPEAPNSIRNPGRNHLGNLGLLLRDFMSGGLSTQREAEAEGIDSYRCSQKQKSKLSLLQT